MLKLRRGVVTGVDPLTVRIEDDERRAWADEELVGAVETGDEVIVNTAARDLGLGSGGFDVVHVNLTRGLGGENGDQGESMKLNYTSLQHPVTPVETMVDEPSRNGDRPEEEIVARRIPVLVLALHGQLAPAAWAATRGSGGLRIGYVQTAGGALSGSLSRDVEELRRSELLCGHITAAPAYGGEFEAVTVIGAIQAAAGTLGWDAVIAGPGPGILGSGTVYGHGGMAALDTAHAAMVLGFETLIAPRLSSGDPRPRHRGLSHHTETVLRMLLGNVRVPAPRGEELEELRRACGDRHELWLRDAAVEEYAESGLPTTTMKRELDDDRAFYAAALAAGDALATAAVVEEVV